MVLPTTSASEIAKLLCQGFSPLPCGVQALTAGEVWEIGVAHQVEPCVAVGLLGCSKWAKKRKVYDCIVYQ